MAYPVLRTEKLRVDFGAPRVLLLFVVARKDRATEPTSLASPPPRRQRITQGLGHNFGILI